MGPGLNDFVAVDGKSAVVLGSGFNNEQASVNGLILPIRYALITQSVPSANPSPE
jgi:hypothetical protein